MSTTTGSDRRTDTQPTPTAAKVAERLGVDRRQLVQFVDYHPDPTAPNLLGWARADPAHEEAVAAWLDDHTTPRADFSDETIDPDDARRGELVQ